MSHAEVATWLRRAVGALPRVVTRPHPRGGVEYLVDEVPLGRVHGRELVDLDAADPLADLLVRNGWAVVGEGGLTVDLAHPLGGTVALWLLCRKYRTACPEQNGADASFGVSDAPPSTRTLDQEWTGSLLSTAPGP